MSEELLKGIYKAGSTIIVSHKEGETLTFEAVEAPSEPDVDLVESDS